MSDALDTRPWIDTLLTTKAFRDLTDSAWRSVGSDAVEDFFPRLAKIIEGDVAYCNATLPKGVEHVG